MISINEKEKQREKTNVIIKKELLFKNKFFKKLEFL